MFKWILAEIDQDLASFVVLKFQTRIWDGCMVHVDLFMGGRYHHAHFGLNLEDTIRTNIEIVLQLALSTGMDIGYRFTRNRLY